MYIYYIVLILYLTFFSVVRSMTSSLVYGFSENTFEPNWYATFWTRSDVYMLGLESQQEVLLLT